MLILKRNKEVALIFSMGIIFRIVLNMPGNKIIEKNKAYKQLNPGY